MGLVPDYGDMGTEHTTNARSLQVGHRWKELPRFTAIDKATRDMLNQTQSSDFFLKVYMLKFNSNFFSEPTDLGGKKKNRSKCLTPLDRNCHFTSPQQ